MHEVERVLRAELGMEPCSPSGPFAALDDEPVGTASLAQVHRAVTHDGKVLALKVRPRL